MSIFTTSLSQLSTPDLQELLDDGAVENARLEFKLEVPNKDETLKKVSSFANTFGGLMVVGAKANCTDGRIEGLPGIDVQAGYKQKIVQWCFDGASPPLTAEVSDPIPTPAANGKVCYVVYTAESDVAPHFLNGRKGVWLRTDEFSSRFEARLADERELRHLFDRRRLILERRAGLLERARTRYDNYGAKMQTGLSGIRNKTGSFLELSIVPRFPARPLCEQEKLRPIVDANFLNWRQVEFPQFRQILSQHESAIILRSSGELSMFEVNIWGMLFYGTPIDKNNTGTTGIHLRQFVGYVLVFIKHAGRILEALGYSGSIHIEAKLASIRGVPWLHGLDGAYASTKSGSQLDNDVTFSITTTSEALYRKSDGIVMDLLRYVFFSTDWPSQIETPGNLETIIREGYDFNSWGHPAKLEV